VLVGFDLPEHLSADFEEHLNALGYTYQEHTGNAAYQFFLGSD
jgi:threonine dehydratase